VTCTGEKFMNTLMTKSEGIRLERPASRWTFNIEIVLKILVGKCVVWNCLVLDKDCCGLRDIF
jgi:hypothetical protein